MSSIIEKLGLGPEVWRLRDAGMTPLQIADQLDLKLPVVEEWISNNE